ncbi:efflux RND transporter permease subunit [Parashewanella tropica]|uniref:efflux RND transporter permease subunit n=1 Tax=Parashewanella tropica TaxID=2547970 RepID=UPI001059563A|nr:efflux RND transporter permease subunit [Parashewanella tropica]
MTNKSSTQKLFHSIFVTPILGILLVLLIIAGGLLGYHGMIKEALPDLKIPIASVSAQWHGGIASIMEREVTEKIEAKIKNIEHLKRYSSGSSFGNSDLIVEFEANAPLESSMSKLRDAVNDAAADLPDNVKKPKVKVLSIRSAPIATFMLFGDVSKEQLDIISKLLKQKLQKINGITRVNILGNQKRYAKVQFIPDRLLSYNISPAEIGRIINLHDTDYPLGVYSGREMPLNIKSQTALYNIKDLQNLPILRQQNGHLVRLKDVAHVEKAIYQTNTETYFSVNGAAYGKGVSLSLVKGPGEDTIKLVKEAKHIFNQVAQSEAWPNTMQFKIISDNAEIIQQELDKTLINGMQSVAVVFLVLFFLLTWREATVAALCIPITFLGSIFVLWLMGFTFNVMMVIGMILALGLLVDDFILMMEGIHEGLFKQKMSFTEAAKLTIKKYAIPSFAGTLTTIIIFIPLASISGIDGKFIKAIPVTAAVCLTVSYIVSLMVSVPLSQFLLSRRNKEHEPFIDKLTYQLEDKLQGFLTNHITHNDKASYKWLGISSLPIVLGFLLMLLLPVTLYPLSDGRNMGITVELPIDYKLDETRQVANDFKEILRKKPYLSSVLLTVGQRDFIFEGSSEDRLALSQKPSLIGFTLLFKPKDQREKLAYQYVPEIRAEFEKVLAHIPGNRLFITAETGGSSNEDPLQINLTGTNIEKLEKISSQIQQRLKKIDGLINVRDNLGQTTTDATIIPKREVLNYYQLSEADFNRQLSSYLGDYKITKLRSDKPSDDIEIRVEPFWQSKGNRHGGPENWREWQSIKIKTPNNQWIPATELADIKYSQAPMTITRKNGQLNVTIAAQTFTLTSQAMQQQINPILQELKKQWPTGYHYKWAGEVELAHNTFGSSEKIFVIAMLAVFSILSLQFGSFKQSLIILVTTLFGVSGVFIGFFIMAYPLSFPAVIGIIALAGITVNDGIVLVDTMNKYKQKGMPLSEAAARGAADRMRPIASTTITTLVGLLPLALADEAWRPLCSAIIFGELLATIAAMIAVPALYRVLTTEDLQHSQRELEPNIE